MAIQQILGVGFHPIIWDAPQKADLILVLESDITSMLPVWGLNFIKAKNQGATLIVADALDTKLAKNSSQWLQIRPGSGEYLLKGMMKILIDEREPLRRQAAELPNFNAFIDSIEKFTPSFVSSLTGLPEQEITDLARVYADSGRRLLAITLGPSENKKGLNTIRSAANLVLLMGDDPATLQIPAELCNTLGMWAMGIHPLADGKDAYDMLYKGRLEALYIMGENPLVTFKNSELVELNLRGLEMLVVQDINYTDTARLADVILPACS
jgi:formate dehydrogenase alpha subunit